MDPQLLSAQLVQSLAPFLPYLVLVGQEAAKTVGEKVVEQGFESAKALWEKLRPKVEAKPAALEAAQDVAKHPNEEDALASLRRQLKKLLEEDKALAQDIARLLEQAPPPGSNRSVTIYGKAENNVIIAGDHNQVNR